MNPERVVREVEKRLTRLSPESRAEVLDALREEIARERRRLDPAGTVESERERRVEAETLREILEAINRQARLEETISEVLKQLSRLVVFDSCSLALADPGGSFRIIAVRGFPEPSRVVGVVFRDPIVDRIRETRQLVALPDVMEDNRFSKVDGTPAVRSWAGIPLQVEGEVIGVLRLDRHSVAPFDDEELHRSKAVAFSAAAAIRKAQLLEQVRRYAALMEQLVAVDQVVFEGRPPALVAKAILEGALRVGTYTAGLLLLDYSDGARVAAAIGPAFDGAEGRPAPPELAVRASTRLGPEAFEPAARGLGLGTPRQSVFVVPFQTADTYMGSLALLDPDGESPDDRLMESYASRAAAALLHTLRRG